MRIHLLVPTLGFVEVREILLRKHASAVGYNVQIIKYKFVALCCCLYVIGKLYLLFQISQCPKTRALSAHRPISEFLLAVAVWAVPAPVFHPFLWCFTDVAMAWGQVVGVGEDVFKSASLTHCLNDVSTKQVVLCAWWCQKEEWESAFMVWTSLLMLFCVAKASGRMQPLGSAGDGHHRGCISGEPVGELTTDTLPRETPGATSSWNLCKDGSGLLKAMTLFLCFSCQYKQMFALNKAARRHQSMFAANGTGPKQCCLDAGVTQQRSCCINICPGVLLSVGPTTCLGHYFFKAGIEMENVHLEGPLILHGMGTAKMSREYVGLQWQMKHIKPYTNSADVLMSRWWILPQNLPSAASSYWALCCVMPYCRLLGARACKGFWGATSTSDKNTNCVGIQ